MHLIDNPNGSFPGLLKKMANPFSCWLALQLEAFYHNLKLSAGKILIGCLVSTSIAVSFRLQANLINWMSFSPVHIFYLYQTFNSKLSFHFLVIFKCVITLFIIWHPWVMEIRMRKKEHHPNSFNNHVSLICLHCCCKTVKVSLPD